MFALKRPMLLACSALVILPVVAQQQPDSIFSFIINDDVKITFDYPFDFPKHKETILVFYALPNGNTTGQTMGRKLQPGDDWHFDIQHIRAQTKFVREELPDKNIVVAYLENNLKSWPAWKQKHADHLQVIQHIVDTLYRSIPAKRKMIYFNGHSGGGSFIFGYIAGVSKIPAHIKRVSFLDSDYGYDSSYYPKLRDWLFGVKNSHLTVFAYNDSVALYNGKPVVSATGGTWYRSHVMMKDLTKEFSFQKTREDSVTSYETANKQIGFFFKDNPDRGIYHTQQVELNGFIHSILFGGDRESRNYKYYSTRAYGSFIQ
jgi:hypothetical protein